MVTADRGTVTGFYCPTCDAARYFETAPDPEWVFCPECGTKMGDVSSRPRYAGFWLRFAGYAIDNAVVYGALALFWFVALWITLATGSGAVDSWMLLAWAVFDISYFLIGNARGGTLGKRLLGLRLINRRGESPGVRASAIRLVVSLFSGLVVSYGYWRMVFDDHKQTWHDAAADTYVVRR